MRCSRVATSVCGLAAVSILTLTPPLFAGMSEGKATYNDSCVHCHGAEGVGSAVMDGFWKMRIPRLNSDYVQKKPDAELSNIILNGKRKMPPAFVGSPETQHRSKVTADQVPDLIAYIRTLKSK